MVTKFWYLKIGGAAYTFATGSLHMGSREAYTLAATDLVPADAATGQAASAQPSRAAPETMAGKPCELIRIIPDGGAQLTFWLGTVTSWSRRRTGGNTMRAAGAWRGLERLVYTRPAATFFNEDDVATVRQTSRVVLGQSATGAHITLPEQIRALAAFAAREGAINVDLPAALDTFRLPFDEMRDATVAQCLDRIMRYIPGTVAAQRLGRTIDIFTLGSGSAADASGYMAAGHVIEMEETADDSAVKGVRVEIERTGSADGRAVRRTKEQTAPAGGTPGPDWMHVSLQLAGRSGSRTGARLGMQTENFPANLDDAAWWRARLGESLLKNAVGLVIKLGARSGAADAALYPRIALGVTPEQVAETGMRARKEKITCLASYTLNDEAGDLVKIIEDRPLELEVVTTNAKTREYTWTTAYSSTKADPEPDGLADALLAQHLQDGRSIAALIRLPTAGEAPYYFAPGAMGFTHQGLPGPGDTYDNLICQTADYDLAAHTVRVVFGPPSHISPQDLATLMVGGRTRMSSSWTAKALATGETDDPALDVGFVAAGGGKAGGDGKAVRIVVPTAGTGGQKVNIDPSRIGAHSATMEPRKISYMSHDNSVQTAYVLSTEPLSSAPGEPTPEDPEEPPPCGHPANAPGADHIPDVPTPDEDTRGESDHAFTPYSNHPGSSEDISPPCG